MKIVELNKRPDTVEYAIGDVHGYLAELKVALHWCAEDSARMGFGARIFLLGDYVDRGPDSKGVLDLLVQGPECEHVEWLPVRGNHDHVFSAACHNPTNDLAREWWEHGGQQTLMSYGWDPIADRLPSDIQDWVPRAHVDFIDALPRGYLSNGRLYAHAGMRPGKTVHEQTDRDLMWIRTEFLKHKDDFGYVVVHGHSPERENPVDHGNRIAMDGGCFYTGNLAVSAFDPGEPSPRFIIATRAGVEIMPSKSHRSENTSRAASI